MKKGAVADATAPFFMARSIDRQQPVIVAMPGVDMVQPAIDQIIDMIAVRHRFVPAARTVDMAAGHRCHAASRIGD
jgi:hypothetical protein